VQRQGRTWLPGLQPGWQQYGGRAHSDPLSPCPRHCLLGSISCPCSSAMAASEATQGPPGSRRGHGTGTTAATYCCGGRGRSCRRRVRKSLPCKGAPGKAHQTGKCSCQPHPSSRDGQDLRAPASGMSGGRRSFAGRHKHVPARRGEASGAAAGSGTAPLAVAAASALAEGSCPPLALLGPCASRGVFAARASGAPRPTPAPPQALCRYCALLGIPGCAPWPPRRRQVNGAAFEASSTVEIGLLRRLGTAQQLWVWPRHQKLEPPPQDKRDYVQFFFFFFFLQD